MLIPIHKVLFSTHSAHALWDVKPISMGWLKSSSSLPGRRPCGPEAWSCENYHISGWIIPNLHIRVEIDHGDINPFVEWHTNCAASFILRSASLTRAVSCPKGIIAGSKPYNISSRHFPAKRAACSMEPIGIPISQIIFIFFLGWFSPDPEPFFHCFTLARQQ